MGDVAGVQRRAVDVRPLHGPSQADDELDAAAAVLLGVEFQEEMFVALQLGADFFEVGHCLRLYDEKRAMALPERIRVKISSEAAGAIAFTPVVASELPLVELLEMAASAVGAEPARVQRLLEHGSLVSGASRFRWERIQCTLEEVEQALRALPQPEPLRPCAFSRCARVVLSGPAGRVEIEKSVGAARRLFRRSSFWDLLMGGLGAPQYAGYCYRERTDRYTMQIDRNGRQQLEAAAALLRYPELARRIRALHVERIDWIVPR